MSLPDMKMNVTTNNLLWMHFVILIPLLAGLGILRKSLQVNITCKATQTVHLLLQFFNRVANILALVVF